MPEIEDFIISTLNGLCTDAAANSRDKGFHGPYHLLDDLVEHGDLSKSQQDMLRNHLDQACMARIAGEVGEVVEAMRHGNPPSEKIPNFSHIEEELADILIRVFDFCGMHGYNLGGAVVEKMCHNASRPHLHGKNS